MFSVTQKKLGITVEERRGQRPEKTGFECVTLTHAAHRGCRYSYYKCQMLLRQTMKMCDSSLSF